MANWDSVSSPIQTQNSGWDAVSSPIAMPQPSNIAEQAQQDAQNKIPFWQGAANAMGIPAARAGLTRIPLGIMQAESEGLSQGANALGMPKTGAALQNTADILRQTAAEESANAENNKRESPIMATVANLAPQALQLAGFGTSLPGIAGAGFTSGVAGPKLTQQDLQQAGYQPANTIADKAMGALSYLPQQAEKLIGINPESRFGQGVTNATGGLEGYGIVKKVPKIADALTPEPQGATQAQVSAMKDAAYAKADAVGGQLNPEAVNQTITKAEAVAPQTPEGKAFAGNNQTTQAVNDLQALKDKPLSLAAYQEIDKDLTNRISKETDVAGNVTPDGKNLIQIRQHLRDATQNAGQSDLVNANGFDSYNQARQLAATDFRMRDVQNIFDNAEMSQNPQTAIRSGFKALVKKGQGGFTDKEWADVNKAARTGIVAGALKFIGGKLVSGAAGMAAGGLGGGPLGVPVGLAMGEAIGYPLRKAGEALQAAPGQALMNKLGNRPVVQDALATNLGSMPAAQAAALMKQIMGMRNRVNNINPQGTQ